MKAWLLDPFGYVRLLGPVVVILLACAGALVALLWPRREEKPSDELTPAEHPVLERIAAARRPRADVIPFTRSFSQPAAKGFRRSERVH